mmetsp:Transcript_15854/g.35692  ORF Transcript_15854/g.35692 Transcript_15854/m.35692 type:complete len:287 (+) Transcript_15854:522-1382(+)
MQRSSSRYRMHTMVAAVVSSPLPPTPKRHRPTLTSLSLTPLSSSRVRRVRPTISIRFLVDRIPQRYSDMDITCGPSGPSMDSSLTLRRRTGRRRAGRRDRRIPPRQASVQVPSRRLESVVSVTGLADTRRSSFSESAAELGGSGEESMPRRSALFSRMVRWIRLRLRAFRFSEDFGATAGAVEEDTGISGVGSDFISEDELEGGSASPGSFSVGGVSTSPTSCPNNKVSISSSVKSMLEGLIPFGAAARHDVLTTIGRCGLPEEFNVARSLKTNGDTRRSGTISRK